MSLTKEENFESNTDLYNHRELRLILELQDRLEKNERIIRAIMSTLKAYCIGLITLAILIMIMAKAVFG